MTYWERFENLCSSFGKKPNPVGKEIGVSSSTITKWKNGAIPSGEILISVADYFNCSVDYLLGRTNNPKINSGNSITTGDIQGNNNANMNFSKMSDEDTESDDYREIVEMMKGLTLLQRSEIVVIISKMKSGE